VESEGTSEPAQSRFPRVLASYRIVSEAGDERPNLEENADSKPRGSNVCEKRLFTDRLQYILALAHAKLAPLFVTLLAPRPPSNHVTFSLVIHIQHTAVVSQLQLDLGGQFLYQTAQGGVGEPSNKLQLVLRACFKFESAAHTAIEDENGVRNIM